MRLSKLLVPFSVAVVLASGGAARAEVKVELANVHLCCGACVKAVAATLKDIDGVKGACDQKGSKVSLTAKDKATAQKAIDALAAAGFHGKPNSDDYKVKDDSGVTAGKVKSLTVSDVHNCCTACCKKIKATVKAVKGVEADTATPKVDTFEVTGDFDAAELVKALNEAGFHVKVKK
jgi:copper chaperone CopZ